MSSTGGSERFERLRRIDGYGWLMDLLARQRRQLESAVAVVREEDLPWEVNPQGIMRWYVHPAIEDTAIWSKLVYVQKIPPGSRSGRQRYQGGVIVYVWKGTGYTVIDGQRHPWKQDQVVQLPYSSDGIVYQHFNADPDEEALLIVVEPNYVFQLGVDRGAGFEQLEPCPEYADPALRARYDQKRQA